MLRHAAVRCTLPQLSENTAAEAASNKLFTTAKPLKWFIQNMASWCVAHNVQVEVNHVAGDLNDWADQLSRPERRASFVEQLDPNKVVDIDLPGLLLCSRKLILTPDEANWPEHVLKLAGYT